MRGRGRSTYKTKKWLAGRVVCMCQRMMRRRKRKRDAEPSSASSCIYAFSPRTRVLHVYCFGHRLWVERLASRFISRVDGNRSVLHIASPLLDLVCQREAELAPQGGARMPSLQWQWRRSFVAHSPIRPWLVPWLGPGGKSMRTCFAVASAS